MTAKNLFISKDLAISIETPFTKESVHAIATFYLPAPDRFAANVNILKEKYDDTMEKYDKTYMEDLAYRKMITREVTDNEIRYDYIYDFLGKILHVYSRKIKRDGYVYTVIAANVDSRWKEQGEELKKSVNSFKFIKVPT